MSKGAKWKRDGNEWWATVNGVDIEVHRSRPRRFSCTHGDVADTESEWRWVAHVDNRVHHLSDGLTVTAAKAAAIELVGKSQ